MRDIDKKHLDAGLVLHAANGTAINTYGNRLLYLDIGFQEKLPWVFTIADITQPIIGSDFLEHHDISIHLRTRTIFHNPSSSTITAQFTPMPSIFPIICHIDNFPPVIENLLTQFPDISKEPSTFNPIKHNFKHRIITNGHPVSVRPRRLNPLVKDAAQDIIQKMLSDGIIRPSSSPWASPVHMVPKKSADWRLVGDYRLLNTKTKKDSYPLPYLNDFSSNLQGNTVFSTIDLKDAFHQIPIADEDIEKTALATPFGSFEYSRMSFGLCGAAQSFQRFIDSVLRNLTVNTGTSERKVTFFSYVDDILVASKNEKDHMQGSKTFLPCSLNFKNMGCTSISKNVHFCKKPWNF